MLNYIWISLIAIGILVAAGSDIRDEVQNTYRNGVPIAGRVEIRKTSALPRPAWEGEIVLSAAEFNTFYNERLTTEDIRQPVIVLTLPTGGSTVVMPIGDTTPDRWKEMAKGGSTKDKLSGNVRSFTLSDDGQSAIVQFELEPVRFLKLKAVTQAAFDIAGTAVNIALGLIGVMAMWLGVMKVAEEAGLLKVLTRVLTPVTRRLFPEVPSDHPAVGAMIMNIAANMLGLSNAATPLGLKAMEELNNLNPKVGTATNAMVTFLAINTGGLILIPATALAVRATVGSANPSLIIGTSIIGAGCATVAGVVASKLLQRLPHYKKELEVSNG